MTEKATKARVLLVGEHPFAFSGNAHFLYAVASLIDQSKYDPKVFAGLKPDMIPDHFAKMPFDVIDGIENKASFCGEHLCQILATNPIDIVIFVGLDCWAYHQVFKSIIQLHKEKKFIWCSIFPCDSYQMRHDWLEYILPIDLPCVYSEYGYEQLKPYVPNIQYFRPPLFEINSFKPLDKRMKRDERRKIFTTVADDQFIFGFIGNNQWRKDPLRTIRAFFNARKTIPNSILYMHTEHTQGVFNLSRYIIDCGGKPGDVFLKQDNARFVDLSKIYNAIDCLVNTSLQEGLSWTILEAMLCQCPVIAADNTSQTELIKDDAAYAIPCTDLAFVPSITPSGQASLEAKACNLEALEKAMIEVATNQDLKNNLITNGLLRAKEWIANTSDINTLIEEALRLKRLQYIMPFRKKGVLFAQHSSAGDVLMTTQCFKGIKERHKGKPLIYMTQKQYQDIVKGNPYVDEIIDWDESQLKSYETIYNPHGEHILRGRFNRLDVTLYSLYPYFCKVKVDDIFIECIDPKIVLPKIYAVVHTTGGDPVYRTYPHMDLIVDRIGMPCVQLGGKLDKACRNVADLRGELSFRESAFIMKYATVAVVVDSFLSHLAGALGTPVVTLFGPAPARVTKPKAQEGKYINLEPNWLDCCADMGGCWGSSINNSCRTPCIETISPLTVVNAVKKLLAENKD